MRLDQALVEKGLVATRSQAQQLIKDGQIKVNGEVIQKASLKIKESDILVVSKDNLWVGRGAEKLAGAHEDFNLSFEDKVVGDMGASTGGFVEYSLFHGAKRVFAVDVGHDQLAPKLKEDPRVVNLEGTNIKEGLDLEEPCDLVVVDLSFISLKLVLDPILAVLKNGGEYLFLVKPQFEVGKEALGKKGLVKNSEAIDKVLIEIEKLLLEKEAPLLKKAPCRVKGNKAGNQEYFFYGKKEKREP